MAADPVQLCLENVTDYVQFERLCCDLMIREGYPNLEPLGGFKDKGRDALYWCETTGETSIFAFGVRKDWRDKLDEDAKKIYDHNHLCQKLVFVSNIKFSSVYWKSRYENSALDRRYRALTTACPSLARSSKICHRTRLHPYTSCSAHRKGSFCSRSGRRR